MKHLFNYVLLILLPLITLNWEIDNGDQVIQYYKDTVTIIKIIDKSGKKDPLVFVEDNSVIKIDFLNRNNIVYTIDILVREKAINGKPKHKTKTGYFLVVNEAIPLLSCDEIDQIMQMPIEEESVIDLKQYCQSELRYLS
jgi:hypothetical protein